MNKLFLIVLLIAGVMTSCSDNGGKKCGPGQIVGPDGCVDIIGDGDVSEEKVQEPEMEGGEEILPDAEDIEDTEDGEEEVCEKTCTTKEDCDDGNVCTLEDCSPVTGCCVTFDDPYLTNGLPCGDDLYCNGIDYCYNFECYTEPLPPECDMENPCSTGFCDEENDICYADPLPDGTSCDDGLYCTGENNTCLDGYCQYTNPCSQIPDNPCQMYVCYEDEPHCRLEPKTDGDPCPDSDPCNGQEFCKDGTCSFVEPACFDFDPCTEDICIPPGDCQHNPIADCSPCPDPSVCDDGNICTQDFCRVVGGETQCERFEVHGCRP